MAATVGAIAARARTEFERAAHGAFSTLLEDRICYSFDATDLRALPAAVAWPSEAGEVAGIIRAATRWGLPVVPRGAGTGMSGGSVPVRGGLVLSFERMNRIVQIDVARKVAVVEPGVVNNDLRERVEPLGLFYPPDPASYKVSTIGGNIAEGAGGPRTVLHGTTRDYVVGLEAVLADGSIVRTGLLSRRTAGPAWDGGPLLVGSEGTLAAVTQAALRLSESPEGFATYWIEFGSLSAAARAVAAITAEGLPVSVLEILDRETVRCAFEYVRGPGPERAPDGALLVELEGDPGSLSARAGRLMEIVEAAGAATFKQAETPEERDEIWEIRRSISPALARLSTGKINEDIAVPRSRIPSFIDAMRAISADCTLPILAFGHAGDGNLHVNVMVDRSDVSQMKRARRAVARLFETALAMGGTLSGEHGIGITKAEHLALELDETALRVTRAVKRALDPDGRLNPDKITTARPNPWWRDIEGEAKAPEPPRC